MADWTPERIAMSLQVIAPFSKYESVTSRAEEYRALLLLAQRGLSAEQKISLLRAEAVRDFMAVREHIARMTVAAEQDAAKARALEVMVSASRAWAKDGTTEHWVTMNDCRLAAFALCPEPKAEGETNG